MPFAKITDPRNGWLSRKNFYTILWQFPIFRMELPAATSVWKRVSNSSFFSCFIPYLVAGAEKMPRPLKFLKIRARKRKEIGQKYCHIFGQKL